MNVQRQTLPSLVIGAALFMTLAGVIHLIIAPMHYIHSAEPLEVIAWDKSGKTEVFASYPK